MVLVLYSRPLDGKNEANKAPFVCCVCVIDPPHWNTTLEIATSVVDHAHQEIGRHCYCWYAANDDVHEVFILWLFSFSMNSRSSRLRSPPRSNEGRDADSRHSAKARSAMTASHCMRRLLLKIKSSWSNSTEYLRHSTRSSLLLFCLAFFVRSMASIPSFLHISDSIPTSNFSVFPRTVRYIVVKDHARVERLPLSMNHQVPKRQVETPSNTQTQKSPGRLQSFETTDCKAQHSWQMGSFPTCNYIYEFGLTDEHARFLANGYWRDVWVVTEEGTGEARVLKTMR